MILFGGVSRCQGASRRKQFAAARSQRWRPELPQVTFALVSVSPLLANGQTVGAMAIYDDPTTQRPADYLEVFDSGGVLVSDFLVRSIRYRKAYSSTAHWSRADKSWREYSLRW